MKKFQLFVLVVASVLLAIACSNQNASQNSSADTTKAGTDTTRTVGQYTCPMHPEVVSDQPGTCPKCGMDLEAKT